MDSFYTYKDNYIGTRGTLAIFNFIDTFAKKLDSNLHVVNFISNGNGFKFYREVCIKDSTYIILNRRNKILKKEVESINNNVAFLRNFSKKCEKKIIISSPNYLNDSIWNRNFYAYNNFFLIIKNRSIILLVSSTSVYGKSQFQKILTDLNCNDIKEAYLKFLKIINYEDIENENQKTCSIINLRDI